MTLDGAISFATQGLALLAALSLARRRPSRGRPVAALLTALLALDVARLGTAAPLGAPWWLFAAGGGGGVYAALAARWALDVALTAGWYVALTAGVVRLLSGPPLRWRYLAAWTALLAAGLVATGWRGPALTSAWRGVWLASAALQTGAAVVWTVGAVRRKRWPGVDEGVALLLWASTVADGAGAWCALPALVEHYRALGLGPEEASRVAAGRAWELARWQSVVTWGAVAGWCGYHLATKQMSQQ